MPSELHKNDAGVQFRITVKDENDLVKDISAATVQQIVFQKPSGELLTVASTFYTDGTDGLVIYTTTLNDLNEIGLWRYQIYLEFTSTIPKRTDVGSFRVYRNLGSLTG